MFKLEFDTDNDAFAGTGSLEAETLRILRDVAASIRNGRRDGAVRDENGNRVGQWELTQEEEG